MDVDHPLMAPHTPDDTCLICWTCDVACCTPSSQDALENGSEQCPTEVVVGLVSDYREGRAIAIFCVQNLCHYHGQFFNNLLLDSRDCAR